MDDRTKNEDGTPSNNPPSVKKTAGKRFSFTPSPRNKELARLLMDETRSESATHEVSIYLGELRKQEEELARQKEALSKDFAARSRTLQERERSLSEQEQSMSAHFAKQQKVFSEQKAVELAILEKEKLQLSEQKNELAKERQLQGEQYKKLLEKNSGEYVQQTLQKLDKRFCEAHVNAAKWQFFGAASLMAGLFYFALSAWYLNPLDTDLGWKNISYLSLRGALIVSLVAGLAAYAARSSKTLRDEATKIADRMHAIDYGAFYLKTYGANADWDQVKEAFKDWNTREESPQ